MAQLPARIPRLQRVLRTSLIGTLGAERGGMSAARLSLLGLALAAFWSAGCENNISIDNGGCAEPKPDIPSDSWCPPAYQCIDGEWVDTGGACPEPDCPASAPSNGEACEMVGHTCFYEEDVPCGPTGQVEANCTSDGWQVTAHYCSPPEYMCPSDLPLAGSNCTQFAGAANCMYSTETPCGQQVVTLSCSSEAGDTWVLDGPAACGMCTGYGNETTCATDPGCQWLFPGCGADPITEGCYPIAGCNEAPCEDGLTCVEKSHDPCYGELCEVCGEPYFTCVSP